MAVDGGVTDYEPPLVHLPGTRLSPGVVLHRTLNKLDHIKGVVVLMQWNDESWSVDWSQLKVSELCMSAMLWNSQVTGFLNNQEPDAMMPTRNGA